MFVATGLLFVSFCCFLMILHSSAQLIFGETTATVQTTSRVSGDVKVVGRRLCERERGIGGGGTSQVSRVTCRPPGRWGQRCPPEGTWHLSHHGRPGRCQSSEGTMAVAIKRPETITYEEKNGQKPLNMILSGKSLNLFVSMHAI